MPRPMESSADVVGLLHRLLWKIGDHARSEAKAHGLPVAELAALRTIRDAPFPTPATVASATHLTRSTMTGVLDRMERKGWLTRERSQSDRRKVVLRLTPAGRERAADLAGPLPVDLLQQIEALDGDRQQVLASLLEHLVDGPLHGVPERAIHRPAIPE